MKLHNLLQQWIYFTISRTIKLESTSKVALFETHLLVVFISLQIHLHLFSYLKT